MRVRVKTIKELESNKKISYNKDANSFFHESGSFYMSCYMLKYCGKEIDLFPKSEHSIYYSNKSLGIYTWEQWMFKEVKDMNRNGANEIFSEGANK